ncbi:MAG: PAS domain S-box protein, partial [Pseudomonadota bacterium]
MTERKRFEQDLKDSEEKYRRLVNDATDGILIAQDEVFRFSNPAVQKMTGYSADELAGMPITHFTHPEYKKIMTERYARRLKGESLPPGQTLLIYSKGGEERWVELTSTLITWEGRPASMSFIRDITTHRKLEDQFRQAQKMEAIGTLAGGVAHDFNNLLTAILGNAELMSMDMNGQGPFISHIEEILRAGRSAASLTRQLLAFSRKQVVQPQVM